MSPERRMSRTVHSLEENQPFRTVPHCKSPSGVLGWDSLCVFPRKGNVQWLSWAPWHPLSAIYKSFSVLEYLFSTTESADDCSSLSTNAHIRLLLFPILPLIAYAHRLERWFNESFSIWLSPFYGLWTKLYVTQSSNGLYPNIHTNATVYSEQSCFNHS